MLRAQLSGKFEFDTARMRIELVIVVIQNAAENAVGTVIHRSIY